MSPADQPDSLSDRLASIVPPGALTTPADAGEQPQSNQPVRQTGTDPAEPNRSTVRLSGLVAGTWLLTPKGYRPVESLRRGDLVAALIGRGPLFVAIAWVGRRTVRLKHGSRDPRVCPVRIRPNALADAMPNRGLLLAPDHAVYFRGMFYLVRQLVNQASILFEPQVRSVEYWGIQLERHDILIAENLPVASLLPASAAAFEEVTRPYFSVVGARGEPDKSTDPRKVEFPAAIRMSARWFRWRLLNRSLPPQEAPPAPVEATQLPQGLLDIQTEVRTVMDHFANLATRRDVHLQMAVEKGLTVRIGRERLQELLGAMLTHAIHGAPGSRVLLGAMRHAGRIQIAVIDEAADVDCVVQEGELRYAMQLAAMQGATLEVDVRPGEGTTLLLRLLVP